MDFSMYSLIFRHMVVRIQQRSISFATVVLMKGQLIPSGGWFGDLVILLSALSGVWDISITAALVVLAYIGLRTTYTEITVVLGALFDLIIPLQYHCT